MPLAIQASGEKHCMVRILGRGCHVPWPTHPGAHLVQRQIVFWAAAPNHTCSNTCVTPLSQHPQERQRQAHVVVLLRAGSRPSWAPCRSGRSTRCSAARYGQEHAACRPGARVALPAPRPWSRVAHRLLPRAHPRTHLQSAPALTRDATHTSGELARRRGQQHLSGVECCTNHLSIPQPH